MSGMAECNLSKSDKCCHGPHQGGGSSREAEEAAEVSRALGDLRQQAAALWATNPDAAAAPRLDRFAGMGPLL